MKHNRKYLICAGEPSGDLLARDVVRALKNCAPDLQAYGVTGRHMEAVGAIPLARTDELMVMGFVDVLAKLPSLLQFEKRFLANAKRLEPEFIILVDYPGLHLRFAEKLRSEGFPIFQLVAPQLWAWKEKRVFRWKESIDKMLGVMPFEEEFFKKYDVPFQYVGTPQVDRVLNVMKKPLVWPVKDSKKTIGFFPGSRESEFIRMAPAYLRTAKNLESKGDFQFYMSIGSEISLDLAEKVCRQHFGSLKLKKEVQDGYEFYQGAGIRLLRGNSLELMHYVDSALVTSGTATLECGLTGTPLCVAYKTSRLNYAIAKRVVTLPNIALLNIVAGERLVEEFVQDLNPEQMAKELFRLTNDQSYRNKVKNSLAGLHQKVHGDMGQNVARIVLEDSKKAVTRK